MFSCIHCTTNAVTAPPLHSSLCTPRCALACGGTYSRHSRSRPAFACRSASRSSCSSPVTRQLHAPPLELPRTPPLRRPASAPWGCRTAGRTSRPRGRGRRGGARARCCLQYASGARRGAGGRGAVRCLAPGGRLCPARAALCRAACLVTRDASHPSLPRIIHCTPRAGCRSCRRPAAQSGPSGAAAATRRRSAPVQQLGSGGAREAARACSRDSAAAAAPPARRAPPPRPRPRRA